MGIIKNLLRKIFRRRKKELTPEQLEVIQTKDYFDRTLPGTVKFYTDHYICGNYYKSIWAITEYPPNTDEMALLSHLADRSGVALRIYNRLVSALEQKKIMQQAARKNHMLSTTNDINASVKAEENMTDIVNLIAELKRDRETLLHTAVFIELRADTEEKLRELQADIQMELTRSKITVDRLLLRQQEGFLSVLPCGNNVFGVQHERVMPSSSSANLYPLNYSGKTDSNGFYIGRDKFGANILVDFDKRTDDKTNSNILILGNSGQGKSYLMKLLLCNMRESGKSVICLDPESEYEDLCNNLGGTYIDMMSGEYMINPLEPKSFGEADRSEDAPDTFRRVTRLSQHISYLKDFFRAYKDFFDSDIDTLEIMLIKLYNRFGIDDSTDYSQLSAEDYPTMADLYELIEKEYGAYDREKKNLYTEETLQNICLGIYSMCKGAEAQYFCGHTNIKDGDFICFGVKGIMDTNRQLKSTLLFNILSYMSSQLLGKGNTVAAIDELYLFLTNMTAIEYIRNGMKRVRKKESAFILATQNIEDFLIPEIREFTKPLFSIPTHSFYFNPGNINPDEFIDTVQLLKPEYDLISHPERGTCIYRCGNERYLLQVHAPAYKEALFGKAGGR
ncbi:VirB4 family type IV secretion system protein [Ruminococcus sp.]